MCHVSAVDQEVSVLQCCCRQGYRCTSGKYEAHSDKLTTMATTQNKTTALHIAAQESDVAAACMLFDKGADLNSVDKYGRTPLHRAVICSKHISQLLGSKRQRS